MFNQRGEVEVETALGHTTVTCNHLIDSFQVEFYRHSLQSTVYSLQQSSLYNTPGVADYPLSSPVLHLHSFIVHRFIYIFRHFINLERYFITCVEFLLKILKSLIFMISSLDISKQDFYKMHTDR